MRERTVKVTILGDADQLRKTFDGASKSSGKLGSALGGMAKIAGGFVLGAGLLKLPGLLSGAAQAAADDEAATIRLNKALANYTATMDDGADALKEITDDMNERIVAGQKLAFSDDDVRDSMQKLLASTNDYPEAARRASAAMDLARGANIPLAQASLLLGKISEDNVEVFKRMGITIGENATEADALAAVQAKFGGQADAYAQSTAGQMEQAKLRMGELHEQIGGFVLPIMTKLGDVAVNQILPQIEQLATAAGPLVARIGEFVQNEVIPVFMRFKDDVLAALVTTFERDVRPKLEAFAAVLRDHVIPRVRELGNFIADKLLPPTKEFINFLADHKEFLVGFGVAIAAIIVPAFVAWAVAAGAAAVATIIATAPVIAIGIAIAALVGGIIWAIRHWDEITAAVSRFAAAVNDKALGAFESLKGGVRDAVNFMIDKINALLAGWNQLEFRVSVPFGGPSFNIGTPDVPLIPRLDRGGIVDRTGLAIVHRGEEFSGVGRSLSRGNTFVFNFPNYVGSRQELRDAMVNVLQDLERVGAIQRVTIVGV